MNSSSDPRIPTPATGFHLERLDEEILLHDPVAAKTLYLNETAALVWELCDGERTEAQIVALLADAFPEAGSMEDDVRAALAALDRQGAVRFAEPTSN